MMVEMGLVGREPYFTILGDGTIFLTVILLSYDVRNFSGQTQCYLHRSDDGGSTWTTVHVEPAGLDPATDSTSTTRNILEMQDGSLLFGVCRRRPGLSNRYFFWRSHDRGRTWSERYQTHVVGLA